MQLRLDDGQRMLRTESGVEAFADRARKAADAAARRNLAPGTATRSTLKAPGR